MAALLPTATSVPSQKIQQDLDANFDAFMDAEYADDQIGELEEEVENEDKINYMHIDSKMPKNDKTDID